MQGICLRPDSAKSAQIATIFFSFRPGLLGSMQSDPRQITLQLLCSILLKVIRYTQIAPAGCHSFSCRCCCSWSETMTPWAVLGSGVGRGSWHKQEVPRNINTVCPCLVRHGCPMLIFLVTTCLHMSACPRTEDEKMSNVLKVVEMAEGYVQAVSVTAHAPGSCRSSDIHRMGKLLEELLYAQPQPASRRSDERKLQSIWVCPSKDGNPKIRWLIISSLI